MTGLHDLLQWIYQLPKVTALRESEDAYPLVEMAHVLAIAVLVGTIVVVDLRVLGVTLRKEPVTRVARALLPLTWCGFGLMLLTGLPLFAAEALPLYGNPAFRLKLLLLALAGCNALLFHRTAFRTVAVWDEQITAPASARVLATLSLALWAGVVVSGRLIAVFHVH